MATVGLSDKRRVFVEAYVRSWNATQAAIEAGYSEKTAGSQGHDLLKNPEIAAAIKQRLEELTMSEAEVLARLTEHARGDIGAFFKVVEEWTQYPLPSYEVIDAKEEEEPPEKEGDLPKKVIVYWVRHIVVDMDKLTDPKHSRLIARFKDSPKDGITIEMQNQQNALKLLGQKYGMFKDRVEMTGADGGPIQTEDATITDAERLERIAALLDRARARRVGSTARAETTAAD